MKMSFERFSSSDLYMFESTSGFIECCGCWFVDWEEMSPTFETPRLALDHLDVHEKAGHFIGHARTRIIQEYPGLDINIKSGQHPPERFRDKANGE